MYIFRSILIAYYLILTIDIIFEFFAANKYPIFIRLARISNLDDSCL